MLQHHEYPAGPENPPDLPQAGGGVGDFAEDQRLGHPIEGSVPEREHLRIAADERGIFLAPTLCIMAQNTHP